MPRRLEPLSDAQIDEYARGVVTNTMLLADATDRDWRASLMLILLGIGEPPENMSTIMLVPMAEHMGGRWLNGRVPGVTMRAHPVPVEQVRQLLDRIDEMDRALNPGPRPESRMDET